MQTLCRILVAVRDPKSNSSPAIAKGARLARAFGAELELFHAIAKPVCADPYVYTNGGLGKFELSVRARYLAQLEVIAARLRREGLTVRVGADWDFTIHEAIVRQVRRSKADMIVAECHASRPLTPWLLHLTDWELLRTSPVPVLLVKSARAWRRPLVLATLDPTRAFAKPAQLDAEILRAGVKVARSLRGSLHAMHAYMQVPRVAVPMVGTTAHAVKGVATGSESRARMAFNRTLRAAKIPPRRRHLVRGLPIDAISRTARNLDSAIVVMGTISRSGLKRVVIGNTAERVVIHLPCDILVVKPTRFVTRVSHMGRRVRYVATRQLPMRYSSTAARLVNDREAVTSSVTRTR